jgi:hypothetical protein
MLLSPFISTTKNKVDFMERFFDTDIAIIVLLLAYIGLAEVNLVVALLVGLIALLAGIMKCITLWQQMHNNRLDREIKQKELDKLKDR